MALSLSCACTYLHLGLKLCCLVLVVLPSLPEVWEVDRLCRVCAPQVWEVRMVLDT